MTTHLTANTSKDCVFEIFFFFFFNVNGSTSHWPRAMRYCKIYKEWGSFQERKLWGIRKSRTRIGVISYLFIPMPCWIKFLEGKKVSYWCLSTSHVLPTPKTFARWNQHTIMLFTEVSLECLEGEELFFTWDFEGNYVSFVHWVHHLSSICWVSVLCQTLHTHRGIRGSLPSVIREPREWRQPDNHLNRMWS